MSANTMTVTVLDLARVEVLMDDGGKASGRLSHDPLRAATIRVLESWVRKSTAISRDELEVLGEHLFETLFEGDARRMLLDRLDDAQNSAPLHLRLVFEEPARALARYSWEYLYLREGGGKAFFLSTFAKLVLSRYMPSTRRLEPLGPAGAVLRILLVVAEPDDPQLGPVAPDPVIDAVQGVAHKLTGGQRQHDGGILRCPTEVRVLRQATYATLFDEVVGFAPHVLHLVGHGRFDRASGAGAVALLKDDLHSVDWVSDKVFKDGLQALDHPPKLVVLHMCQGGEVAFERNFAGVAPQLITAGVQAVIAMQHPISNAAATRFAEAFYKRIGRGEPVDHAVQFGRSIVSVSDRTLVAEHAFGTPVLYMRAADGIIVPQEVELPAHADASGGRAALRSTAGDRGEAAPPSHRDATDGRRAGASGHMGGATASVPSPMGGNVAQVVLLRPDSAEAGDALAEVLRRVRKTGLIKAAQAGLGTDIVKAITAICRASSIDEARDALERRIDDSGDDDRLQSVWVLMLGALVDGGG